MAKKRKQFNSNYFDKVMYSAIRRHGVPYSLGCFDKRVYILSNSYRPSNPILTKSSDNDIVYYFKENKLTFVKSGNLYQIENNQAFAFNERNKFVCGGRYEIYPTLNKSIFIEEGGITQYEFYSDDSFKRGILLSLNSYSFLISEYSKKGASGLKIKLFNMDYFHLRKQLKY